MNTIPCCLRAAIIFCTGLKRKRLRIRNLISRFARETRMLQILTEMISNDCICFAFLTPYSTDLSRLINMLGATKISRMAITRP